MLEVMVKDNKKSLEEKKKLVKAAENVESQIKKHKIAERNLQKEEKHTGISV